MKIKKIKKTVRRYAVYLMVLFFVKILRAIPRRVGIAVMRFFAIIFYVMLKKQRQNTIAHLRLAFKGEKTDAEIKQIARGVFLHLATAGVDAIRIPVFCNQGMDDCIKVENIHYMEQARAEGKGMIVLTGHFGNWELMGAWMAQHNHQIRVVGKSNSNPWLEKLILDTRNHAGYINLHRGKATREIVGALKKGYTLGMLIDQDTKVKGVFVDFFGRKAHTPIGPVLLASRFDVPIIPMFMHLEKDLTYHLECFEPIRLVRTDDPRKDIITNTQKCSDVYEAIIRRYPEQWVWMHRRWKTRPDDEISNPGRSTPP